MTSEQFLSLHGEELTESENVIPDTVYYWSKNELVGDDEDGYL